MNRALVAAAEHGKRCAGSISGGKENTPSHLCGGFFSTFALKCSIGCHIQLPFETDYFTKPPNSKVKAGCSVVKDSAMMGIFQTAVRNMSYVHSEIQSLFKLMGLKFCTCQEA